MLTTIRGLALVSSAGVSVRTPEEAREDALARDAEDRLERWARNLHYPGFNVWPSENMLQRRRLDRRNVAAGVQRSSMDIIDGVPCTPDGGVGAMVDRMYMAVTRSRECREVGEWLESVPEFYRELVKTAYIRIGLREDAPTAEQAAKRIGISRASYFRHKRKVLLSLAAYLCLAPEAAAAA